MERPIEIGFLESRSRHDVPQRFLARPNEGGDKETIRIPTVSAHPLGGLDPQLTAHICACGLAYFSLP